MHRLLGGQDLPVDRPIAEYRGRAEIEGLLRGKGVFYFVALRKLLGDELFFRALRAHVTANRFRFLETDGLLVAIAGLSPGKAEAALKLHDRYLNQTKGDDDIGKAPSMSSMLKRQGIAIDPATKALLDQLMGGGLPTMPSGTPPGPGGAPGP
jgi:hypothetical protein